jgi:eukaryotic-like serine/threonine-protein kinase
MNLAQGRVLGRYEILGPLGSGGMGEVYRARDLQLKREVAVKVLPEHVAGNPDSLSRFEREALTLAQLSHPNILSIHDFGRYNGVTLAVMELLEGETLRRRIESSALSARRSLEIGAAIAEGLAVAHTKGIVHRDLKPENVFITNDNQVKILDFGLARMDSPGLAVSGSFDSLPTETVPGMVRGTIGYMSPEQLRGTSVDGRSDIFSLGCVLYEMLTGRRAFAKATIADTMTAILTEDPPDFLESGRIIPPEAERVTTHCLEKEPSRRYQSAQDLALHLRTLASNPEISSPRTFFPSRLSRTVLLGLVLTLVLVVGVSLWRTWTGRAPTYPAPPEQRPSVAVMFFENLTGDASLNWMRPALTTMLVTDLSQSPYLEVLGTDRLYQILDELGRTDDPTLSFDTVQQVARRARVSTVVIGSYIRAGDAFRLSTRLQEAESGRILATESVEGVGEASMFSMVDEITHRIKSTLEVATADASMDKGIEAVTSSSVEAYRYYVEGNELHMRSREREAVPLLERAVSLDPDFAMALAKLSVAHWNLGHQRESYEYARKALEHVDRLTARERYYIEGRYYSLNPTTLPQAIAAYERAINLYPDHGPARHNLANIYTELERYGEAITHYEELIRNGSHFAGTFTNLANTYAAAGDLESGRKILDSYVARFPESATARRDLGAYLLRLGELEDARRELLQAAALDPGDMQVKLGEIELFLSLEDFDAARGIVEELLSAPRPAWRVEGRLAESSISLFQGNSSVALRSLRSAEEMVPDAGPLRCLVLTATARAHLLLDQPEPALRAAEAAFEAGAGYPAQIDALVVAALAKARLSRAGEALGVFEELRSRYSSLPERLVDRRDNHLLGLIALLEGKLGRR